MLKCNQVTRLVAAEEYQELGVMKKMEFRLHLMMCSHCHRYVDQIKRLGSGARQRAKSLMADDEQLVRMEKNIQEDLNKSGE
jgi:hypothetical protein